MHHPSFSLFHYILYFLNTLCEYTYNILSHLTLQNLILILNGLVSTSQCLNYLIHRDSNKSTRFDHSHWCSGKNSFSSVEDWHHANINQGFTKQEHCKVPSFMYLLLFESWELQRVYFIRIVRSAKAAPIIVTVTFICTR